jgi:hypothetical protein
VLPHHEHIVRHRREHLGAQVSEPSIPEDDNPFRPGNRDLRRDLKSRRDRFGEYRNIVGNRVWHSVEIPLRYGNQIGKGTVVIEDPEHRAVRAVGWEAAAACVALPARAVDLTHHALPGEVAGLRHADKLVAQDPAESHIALDQLQVCFADTGAGDPDQDLAVGRRWCQPRGVELNRSVKNDGAHGNFVPRPPQPLATSSVLGLHMT